jgi:prefoldin subunit 5
MDNETQRLNAEVERLSQTVADLERQVTALRAALAMLAKSTGAPDSVQEACGVKRKPAFYDQRQG